MATQRINLAVNVAANLLTEPTTDLTDGTIYAIQNKGPGNVALSVAATVPNPLTAAAFALLPLSTYSITVDSAMPIYGWAIAVPSYIVVTEG